MKFFYLVLLLILPLVASGEAKYGVFIDKQIDLVHKINDNNATQESILKITTLQEKEYLALLEKIVANKASYINNFKSNKSKIYALEKIIKLNKRHSNKYAVIRDEVLIKSYKIIHEQNIMIGKILKSLDKYEYAEFQVHMSEMFAENQIKVHSYNDIEYANILEFKADSKVIIQAQTNIKDFYALLEVNSDVLKYLSIFDKKLYTLNKYSQLHLIKPILFINSLEIVKSINSIILPYDLNIVKLLIIALSVLFVYLIRKVFYNILERYIVGIKSLEKYSKDILSSVRKLIEISIILININLIIYVYNDFVSVELISKSFNMVYGFLFTFIIYRVANAIATIKINELHVDSNSIKYEVINVGIKIVNFTIWIIGLLIILFLAGVNLTAVLSGLGIGGFAVALAAKDSLANFFGTLSILLSETFSQGDWIDVAGQEGTVVEIGLRVTTMRTFDNALISISNSVVANSDVKNWSKRSMGRRIKMSIGVKYDSTPQDIKNVIEQIYNMLDKHPGIATINTEYKHIENYHRTRVVRSKDDEKGVKKTLLVYLDEFGDSSINILVYCFSKTVVWKEWLEVKQDVMFKMMEILEKNNVEFAFPSMSIYNEKEDK